MRTDTTTGTHALSRRRVLAAGAVLGISASAGCGTIVNSLAGAILDDVNVLNGTDQQLTGTITVTDPAGETVLEDSFDVRPDGENDTGSTESEEETQAIFSEVFTETGEYRVTVELDADSTINGNQTDTQTVEVTNTEEEHIMVLLGATDDGGISSIVVIEELTDLEELADNETTA